MVRWVARWVARGLLMMSWFGAAPLRADRPNGGDCERPMTEVSAWLAGGGGAVVLPRGQAVEAVMHAGVGWDWTFGLALDGNARVGPWAVAELMQTGNATSLMAGGGLELLVAELPADWEFFQYTGEGVLIVRAGAGRAMRDARHGSDENAVLATIAWGYRAPWNLWDRWRCGAVESRERNVPQRYMIGARFYLSAAIGVNDHGWSVVGGIEFEPAGAIRYFFGLY